MHKISSDLAQRRARQLWLRDLPLNVDWDNLPAEEKRANLVRAANNLKARIVALPKKSIEREQLGMQAHVVNTEINAIRAKQKGPKGTAQHFIEVCREKMGRLQFSAIMAEASNRARADAETSDSAYLSAQLDGAHP